MSMSIFSLTKGGYKVAKQLNKIFPSSRVYVSDKIGQAPHHLMDGNFKSCVREAFERDTALVFVMASGIVVRTIAPLLKSKTSDPAVIVMDEKGQHVISLLSGHIGGGNALASEIAEAINGKPIITTSSDVQGKIAIDVFAMKNGLVIDNMKDATTFASGLVNGERLSLFTDAVNLAGFDDQWHVEVFENGNALEKFFLGKDLLGLTNTLVISNRTTLPHVTLRLIPQNIVLGIGCRRGVRKERLLKAMDETMASLKLDKRSLKCIGTVDVKADEQGLIEAAESLDLPLRIIERDQIKRVQDQFEGSDFVEKTIGVRAVCEPSAMLASGRQGRFLMEKTSYDGITIAVWEEIYEIR
jgi:cobalt-precorrin 5A hydrolase